MFLALIVASVVLTFVAEFAPGHHREGHLEILGTDEMVHEQVQEGSSSSSSTPVDTAALLAALTEKLTTPREFALEVDDGAEDATPTKLSVHQFLHLHHMKVSKSTMRVA